MAASQGRIGGRAERNVRVRRPGTGSNLLSGPHVQKYMLFSTYCGVYVLINDEQEDDGCRCGWSQDDVVMSEFYFVAVRTHHHHVLL